MNLTREGELFRTLAPCHVFESDHVNFQYVPAFGALEAGEHVFVLENLEDTPYENKMYVRCITSRGVGWVHIRNIIEDAAWRP